MKAWTDCILDRLVGITATGGRAVAIEVAEESWVFQGDFQGAFQASIREFPKIGGTSFWSPYNTDPPI